MSVLRHILSFLLLPGIVTLGVPALLLRRPDAVIIGEPSPLTLVSSSAGVLFIAGGLALMYQTISLFATIGKGTLAPWDPPTQFVIRGIYRHVRNPMITGVFSILLGEAVLFRSSPLLGWFITFALMNAVYIPLIEEPGLARRFGDDYRLYKQNVPRRIPRLKPWTPPATSSSP